MTDAEVVDFGARLRRLREAAGLTQEELAERAGLTAQGVGALERGDRRRPYPATVRALAEALGLPADARDALLAASRRSGQSVAAAPEPDAALPTPPTPLVGRERDVAAVAAHLAGGDRLLTLTGPGGVGKSRLALAVVDAMADHFLAGATGAAFVALAPLSDPELVVPTIAAALGVREGGGGSLRAALHAAVRGRRLLLVLDNVEHLLAAAPAVADLLAACPALVVLATSRAPLHLRGEREYPVAPLALPTRELATSVAEVAEAPAVRLFVERAQAQAPAFRLTEANAAAVATICRRLDGLPLALELAAAWAKLLSPAVLLARLDRALPMLTGGPRDLPARQRTLGDTVAWSYDLLEPADRGLFRQLAVFAGGFTLEAAEAVGAPEPAPEAVSVIGSLARLVDQSLVLAEAADGDGLRYRLLEPIREFAAERLAASGERDAAQRRHAVFYLALAEQAGLAVNSAEQAVWLDRLEVELANLRSALGWAFEAGHADLGLRLAVAPDRFWQYRGYVTEGRRWLERGLTGDRPAAPAVRAKALALAGWLAPFQLDLAGAATLLEEGLALYRDLGDEVGLINARDGLGDVAHFQGDQARARALHQQNLARRRALGDRWGVSRSLHSLAWVALARSETAEADALLGESLALVRALGDTRGVAVVLISLSWVALASEDYPRATAVLTESLALSQALRLKPDLAFSLLGLAAVAAAEGRAERAARLFGAAEAMLRTLNIPLPPGRSVYYERAELLAREQLGASAWGIAWTAGQALSPDAAVAEALDSARRDAEPD